MTNGHVLLREMRNEGCFPSSCNTHHSYYMIIFAISDKVSIRFNILTADYKLTLFEAGLPGQDRAFAVTNCKIMSTL